jgi:hypothetical protein
VRQQGQKQSENREKHDLQNEAKRTRGRAQVVGHLCHKHKMLRSDQREKNLNINIISPERQRICGQGVSVVLPPTFRPRYLGSGKTPGPCPVTERATDKIDGVGL